MLRALNTVARTIYIPIFYSRYHDNLAAKYEMEPWGKTIERSSEL